MKYIFSWGNNKLQILTKPNVNVLLSGGLSTIFCKLAATETKYQDGYIMQFHQLTFALRKFICHILRE